MKIKQLVVALIFFLAIAILTVAVSKMLPDEALAWTTVAPDRADGSVVFVENMGQFNPRVKYQARAGGEILWLSDDGLWITLLGQGSGDVETKEGTGVNLKISFGGANPKARIEPFAPVDPAITYGTSSGGHPNVPVWAGVRYLDLYPGVDLELFGRDGRWEWQIVAHGVPTMDEINLRIEGADSLALVGAAVELKTVSGDYSLPDLFPGARNGQGVIHGDSISLDVPRSISGDIAAQTLSTRPQSGENAGSPYSTFIGGSAWDEGRGIAVDAAGSAYVTGYTESVIFPSKAGSFEPNHGIDVFVIKVDPTGSGLDYVLWMNTTTLNAEDYGNAITIDETGHAYVAGYTFSTDYCAFLGAVPGYDVSYNGDGDAYIMKVSQDGSGLDYCTYLGGSDLDLANGIALDESGNVYVTGSTWSTEVDFPITPGAYDPSHNGLRDVFVSKLDVAGTSLLYSTFLGGNGQEEGRAIALDGGRNAYVTGWTTSPDFETTPGAFSTLYNGGAWDAFVFKLNGGATVLNYSTFMGGGEEDRGRAIAITNADEATITGMTRSSDFPTTPGAFDTSFGGGNCGGEPCSDAFVARLDPAGDGLAYSTYLGGSLNDEATGLHLDASGAAFVCGATFSPDFPIAGLAFDPTLNGGKDAFFSEFDVMAVDLTYSTFVGGSQDDSALSLWQSPNGKVTLTGRTQSANFPVSPGSYDESHNGDNDIFVFMTIPSHKAYLPLAQKN